MRIRRASTFLLAAAALCAALFASAADEGALQVPPSPPPATIPAADFQTPDALKLNERFLQHEQNVLSQLTGTSSGPKVKASSFADLRGQQAELAASLSQAVGLTSDERAALTAHLQEIGRLLFMTEPLARGGNSLDPKLQQVLREAAAGSPKDAVNALMQVSGQLLEAASNPQTAATVFDNLGRRGGETKSNLDAVRAEFGTKAPIVFTPADDPRTLAGIMALKETPPAPLAPAHAEPQADAAQPADATTAAAALLAAYKPFRLQLPDGAEKQFQDERAKQLGDLRTLAEAAERSFGGDPSTMSFDALIEELIAREARVAANVGAGADITDYSQIPARLAQIRKVNPQLASFMAGVWLYRSFLRQEMADNHVALGTKFKPWETFPDGQGTQGAVLEGFERDGHHFVGLAYTGSDGSTRFQGASKETHQGLVILAAKDTKTVTQVDFDGSGKVTNALSELYQNGVLTRRETVDGGAGVSTVHTFKDGKEVKVETADASGGRRIQDLLHGVDTTISKDRQVQIHGKPAPPGTPPVPILQVGEIDDAGNFVVQKMVMQDGQQILTKSPHVTQMLSSAGANQGWNVDIGDLVALDDPAKRQTKAHAYAEEIVKDLFGSADAEHVKVLEGFLLDYAKSGAGVSVDANNKPSVRLFINDRKTFMLMFGKTDGTRRIVSGVFKDPPVYLDHAQGTVAFGVMGEITAGADGKVTQDDPTIQYEYIFDGSRLHWAPPTVEVIHASKWTFWKDDTKVTHFYIQKEVRSGSGWNASGGLWESQKSKLSEDQDGTSLTSWLASGVSHTPVIGPTLNFVGDTLGTVYKGAHALVDDSVIGVMDLANADPHTIDAWRVERDANNANNPLTKLIIGGMEPNPDTDPEGWRAYHQKLVDANNMDLTPGERQILADQAKKDRLAKMTAKGWTADRAPEAFNAAQTTSASDDEVSGALSKFGAGSYGRRLAEAGHPFLGAAVQCGEVVVESLPAGFLLGMIGKGAEAMQLLAEAMPRAALVFRVGEVGLRGLDYIIKPTIVTQVALLGADHIGKAFQYRDDPTKFAVNAGNALGDIAFGGLMMKGWLNSRVSGDLSEIKVESDKALTPEAPPPVVDAPIVRAPDVVEPLVAGAMTADAAIPTEGIPGAPASPAVQAPAVASDAPAPETRAPAPDAKAPVPDAAAPVPDAPAPVPDAPAPDAKAPVPDAKTPVADDKAPDAKAPADKAPSNPLLSWLSSSPFSRLASLLSRATAESAKLGDAKVDPLDEGSVKSPTRVSANGPAEGGPGLAADKVAPSIESPAVDGAESEGLGAENSGERTVAPAGNGPERVASAENAERVPAAENAERVANAENAEETSGRSGRVLNLESSERVPAGENGEAGGDRTADKTGDKIADKSADKTDGKTEDKTGDKKADRKPEKAPRTDRLGRWADKLEGKTMKVGPLVAVGVSPIATTPPPLRKTPPDSKIIPVSDDPPITPVKEGPPDGPPSDPPDDPPADPPTTPIVPKTRPTIPSTTQPTVPPTTPPTETPPAAPPAQGRTNPPSAGASAAAGGPSDKHPNVSVPSGGGGGGGGGGGDAGGGQGGAGGGGSNTPAGAASGPAPAATAPAAEIPAAPLPEARPAPFVPSFPGTKSAVTANGIEGGHNPAPSLAAGYDGSVERPRAAAGAPGGTMTGLSGSDSGLPTLPRHDPAPPTAPTASGDALKDLTAAAAAPAVAPAAVRGAAAPEAEDYNYTYLAPAGHKYELPLDPPPGSRDWRALAELVMEGSAALAAVYLFVHSDLGYLVGMTRRRNKTGGES